MRREIFQAGATPEKDLLLNPETRLLLACAKMLFRRKSPAQPDSLPLQAVGWKRFLSMTEHHRLSPFLPGLLASSQPDIPRDIGREIEKSAQINAVRQARMRQTLLRVSGLLENAGIRALACKGPVLSERAYGDAILRPCDDLDFLIHPSDAEKTENVMKAEGFNLDPPLTEAQRKLQLLSRRDWLFRENETGISVDMNLATAPLYLGAEYPFDSLFEKSELVRIGGKDIRTLGLEDTLLDLCVHGTKHRWCRLIWICDLAGLMDKAPPLDWDPLIRYARQLGCLRLLLTGFYAVHALLEIPIPDALEKAIRRDPCVAGLAEQSARLFAAGTESSPEDTAAAILFQVHSRERIRDKVLYLLKRGLYPSSADWEFLRLPPALSFLYYLIRPFRLAFLFAHRIVFRK